MNDEKTRRPLRRIAPCLFVLVVVGFGFYRLDHFQLWFDVVRVMRAPEEDLRSLSRDCLPSSEPVGDEARWKYDVRPAVVMGDVWLGSKGWRISFHEVATCLARCDDSAQEGDMVVLWASSSVGSVNFPRF